MIKMRVCYFCYYDRGEGVKAIAWYEAEDEYRYDVCLVHKKTVDEADTEVHKIDDPFEED